MLHSCGHRWGFAEGAPGYVDNGARLHPAPLLLVLTLVLRGGEDTCNHLDTSQGRVAFFQRRYESQVLDGHSHFPQREVPKVVADAIMRFCQLA